MQEMLVQFLSGEDTLKKEMATHFSIIAWNIPWTEDPGRLQSMGSQRVGHNWTTNTLSWEARQESYLIACSLRGTLLGKAWLAACHLVLKFHLLWSQCADWVRQAQPLLLLKHPCRMLSVHHMAGSTTCLILFSHRWEKRASRIIREAWIWFHAFFFFFN